MLFESNSCTGCPICWRTSELELGWHWVIEFGRSIGRWILGRNWWVTTNHATQLDISNLGQHNPGARADGTPCTENMKSDRISKSAISSSSFYHSYSTTHFPYSPGFAEDAGTLSNRPRTSLQKGNFNSCEMQPTFLSACHSSNAAQSTGMLWTPMQCCLPSFSSFSPYSALQISVVKGCVSAISVQATFGNFYLDIRVQGDHSRCSQPFIDIITKVPF